MLKMIAFFTFTDLSSFVQVSDDSQKRRIFQLCSPATSLKMQFLRKWKATRNFWTCQSNCAFFSFNLRYWTLRLDKYCPSYDMFPWYLYVFQHPVFKITLFLWVTFWSQKSCGKLQGVETHRGIMETCHSLDSTCPILKFNIPN